ncbi:MAG: ComEC/Rec2 family competence protein, partial [Bdellovibrionota bacterium]
MIFIFWFALGKQWIVWLSLSASQYCAELSPASAYSPLLKGLVCGVSLNPSSETTLLREYSLTHLIVVSGSHFVLLENIINLLGLGRWATFICWFFNIATGFQAPGTRAVVEMSLRKFFKKNSLFYPPEFSVLISFIICLLFFPEWGKSFSFFLSTLCAWILSLSLDPLPKFLSAAFKVFFLYI